MSEVRRARKDMLGFFAYFSNQMQENGDGMPPSYEKYDADTLTAHVVCTVHGIRGSRRDAVEHMRVGQAVKIEFRGEDNIVFSQSGAEIGHFVCGVNPWLPTLVSAGEAKIEGAKVEFVVPMSKRPPRSKVPLLQISFDIKLKERRQHHLKEYSSGCILCHLGGDHQRIWAQKLTVMHLNMPLERAKLIFEIYNRIHDEYENPQEPGYAGLDNLDREITAAREKMGRNKKKGLSYAGTGDDSMEFGALAHQMIQKEGARYGELRSIIDEDDFSPLECLSRCADDEAVYCWWDMTRVDEDAYERKYKGSSHWYEILQLYGPGKLPFDLKDPDIMSIFGFGKFEALADLSYGC